MHTKPSKVVHEHCERPMQMAFMRRVSRAKASLVSGPILGMHWMKILSLVMRYNGLPSVLLGSFTALVMAILVSCDLLPRIQSGSAPWSMWTLGSGFAASVITFCFWQPRQLIFLDRICINEKDQYQKATSIFSLAGIVKRSDEMLVLWMPHGVIGCGVYLSWLRF